MAKTTQRPGFATKHQRLSMPAKVSVIEEVRREGLRSKTPLTADGSFPVIKGHATGQLSPHEPLESIEADELLVEALKTVGDRPLCEAAKDNPHAAYRVWCHHFPGLCPELFLDNRSSVEKLRNIDRSAANVRQKGHTSLRKAQQDAGGSSKNSSEPCYQEGMGNVSEQHHLAEVEAKPARGQLSEVSVVKRFPNRPQPSRRHQDIVACNQHLSRATPARQSLAPRMYDMESLREARRHQAAYSSEVSSREASDLDRIERSVLGLQWWNSSWLASQAAQAPATAMHEEGSGLRAELSLEKPRRQPVAPSTTGGPLVARFPKYNRSETAKLIARAAQGQPLAKHTMEPLQQLAEQFAEQLEVKRQHCSWQAASPTHAGACMAQLPMQGRGAPDTKDHTLMASDARDSQIISWGTKKPRTQAQNADLRPESIQLEQASSVAKRSGKEDQDEDDLCVVCWEKMRDVIFFPCMHMCTCPGCTKDIVTAGGLCPMCRAKVLTSIPTRF